MPLPVGLVDACDDPRLFGVELYPKQRDRLAGLEAGPRLQVWALGRRAGKSLMCSLGGLHACLLRPELLERLRPGERGYAVAIATNLRQARLIVQAARSVIEHSPLLAEMVESVTEDVVYFTNGTAFAAFPCSSRGGRGWPIFFLAMDEAAHFLTETDGPAVADKVFEALAPSTATFGDLARIIVCSTPYGEDGFFASLYSKAASGELPDAVAAHASTAEMNPMVDESFLAREEARDPDAYRGEYLAEFLASGSAFLDLERVSIADRGVLPKAACPSWVAGLDPAFSSDPFGLAIIGKDTSEHPPRLRLGFANAYLPLKGVGSFDDRLEEIVAVLKSYGVTQVATDQFSSAAVIDFLAKHGISARLVSMNAASKTLVYTELRGALYTGTLELYEHPDLLAELRRLRTRFSAGQSAVVNPRVGRSHGDMAQAIALALQVASVQGGSASLWCYRCDPGHDLTGPNGHPCLPPEMGPMHPTAGGLLVSGPPDVGVGSDAFQTMAEAEARREEREFDRTGRTWEDGS